MADRAGLKSGDRIVAMGGRRLTGILLALRPDTRILVARADSAGLLIGLTPVRSRGKAATGLISPASVVRSFTRRQSSPPPDANLGARLRQRVFTFSVRTDRHSKKQNPLDQPKGEARRP